MDYENRIKDAEIFYNVLYFTLPHSLTQDHYTMLKEFVALLNKQRELIREKKFSTSEADHLHETIAQKIDELTTEFRPHFERVRKGLPLVNIKDYNK